MLNKFFDFFLAIKYNPSSELTLTLNSPESLNPQNQKCLQLSQNFSTPKSLKTHLKPPNLPELPMKKSCSELGCHHYCDEKEAKCRCRPGYYLSGNKRSCYGEKDDSGRDSRDDDGGDDDDDGGDEDGGGGDNDDGGDDEDGGGNNTNIISDAGDEDNNSDQVMMMMNMSTLKL